MKYSDIYVDYTYGRENKSGWEGARTVLKITYKSTYRDEGADRIITAAYHAHLRGCHWS